MDDGRLEEMKARSKGQVLWRRRRAKCGGEGGDE